MTATQLPIIVAYGGGTNSTAMLCGFRERGIRPALILFADTGAEHQHTYAHLAVMQAKCLEWFGLTIETVRAVRKTGEFEGLEGECLRRRALPSLAYAFKRKNRSSATCSQKFKVSPQAKRVKAWLRENHQPQVARAIGFDAAESHRVKPSLDAWAVNLYPLVEWNWRRAECVDAICRHGLTQPGKSSCFFCPAMRPSEVLNLKDESPDLYARAIAIERLAQTRNRSSIGLGGAGNYWEHWGNNDNAQGKLLDIQPMHQPCHCTDQSEEA